MWKNKTSNPADAAPAKPLSGLRGWLLLPFLGVIVTTLKFAVILGKDIPPALRDPLWSAMTVPGGIVYDPINVVLIVLEACAALVLTIWSGALVCMFITRHWKTPAVYIRWVWVLFLYTLTDIILSALSPPLKLPIDAASIRQIMTVGIGATVWTLYMLKSVRVRNTFQKR